MTLYVFGAEKLVRRHFEDNPVLVPLRLHHLPRLGPDDVIVTPRPWSPMLEAMVFWRNAHRPRILQVADGIVFPANATKRKNQRYGGLQRHIFADGFLALQNASDFDLMSDEPELVRSAIVMDVESVNCDVDGQTVILASGNDPFFDFPPDQVIQAFAHTVLRLTELGVKEVLLSCPNARLRKALEQQNLPGLHSIGRITDIEKDLTKTLMVGSPSTVLLDHMRRGGTSLLIDFYKDPVLLRYFSPETAALQSAVRTADDRLTLQTRRILSQSSNSLSLNDVLDALSRRENGGLPKARFFSALRLRLIVRELQLLLG